MLKIFLISFVVVICLFALFLIALYKQPKNDPKPNNGLKKKPRIKMLNRDGDTFNDEWHTYIAGLPYHASKYDIGGFSGWVENDFNNAHDHRAMGIYNSFGKLLGYIPAKELSDYRDWCEPTPQPCVGFIYAVDDQLRGRVKILRPCNEEFLQTEFSSYLQWVNDNYGAEYLPKNLNITFDTE